MRSHFSIFFIRAIAGFAVPGLMVGAAFGADAPRNVSLATEADATGSAFNPAQLEIVQRWVREDAPGCPPEVLAAVAQKFLEVVQQRDPGKLEQLLTTDFPRRAYQSTLLRLTAAQLGGTGHAALREELARRRLQAVVAQDAGPGVVSATGVGDAAILLTKIRGLSEVYHRRLVEGRTEDDDLRILLRKVRQSEAGAKPEEAPKPKTLSAADIVSAFARQNQEGSAAARLRSYALEGRMKSPTGEDQTVFLFRLRPDRFRLAVAIGGETKYVLAFDGQHYWRQAPGRVPNVMRPEAVGRQRYLAEFIDGLFGEAGAKFERLEDGAAQGRPVFRIAVRRGDGSRYVARIDQETYRQVGRENEDKSTASYSDFREVAGVTIAFREEVTDAEGRTSTLELARLTPNPGLIQAFFEPPTATPLDFFALERMAKAAPTAPLK